MAAVIYLDTHVVAWLYAKRIDNIPAAARQAIEEHDLLVSPMVVLELQYLYEIGRTKEAAEAVIGSLGREIGLEVCDLAFAQVMGVALDEDWTRDPFDRLIVSQAKLREAELVSKDATIREHYSRVIWDGTLPERAR
jgi:PIN domain nuclease of toxin-antitoxin system